MEEPLEIEDALIVVKLDCGIPISVKVSHPDLEGIRVAYVESSDLTDEYDDPIELSPDEIVVLTTETQYEDLEELQSLLETSGID